MKLVPKKNVVAGLGEIGMPICKVLSKKSEWSNRKESHSIS